MIIAHLIFIIQELTNQMNDPIEIPSLEQIEQMERQQLQVVQTLELNRRMHFF